MKIENLPDVLTATDVSKFLGISANKTYELMRINQSAGGLPVLKIGRNVRVLKSDLIAWIDSKKEA